MRPLQMYAGGAAGNGNMLIASSPATGQSYWLTGAEIVNGSGVHFVPSMQGLVDYGVPYAARVSVMQHVPSAAAAVAACALTGRVAICVAQ